MNSEIPIIFTPEFCRKFAVAPLFEDNRLSGILLSQDINYPAISLIRFSFGWPVPFIISDRESINTQIEKLFSGNQNENGNGNGYCTNLEQEVVSESIIRLIDETISTALSHRASDIHLEPFEKSMMIRYRIDGVLQEINKISRISIPPVVSRIKIMSGLDIAEKRRPQDGRIRFPFEDRAVDIRVSILPTDFGEKIVLRLLDKASLQVDLDGLGFGPGDLQIFKENISLPNGLILLTGPTGSGKTTTLYAAMSYIKSPGINITTIEDPIEYNLEGINQTQVKPEIGLTFASSLRSILRQDPNVIMVGEIRDSETLENALRASLTGHLVLTTLHTNDSFSTLARLKDLGADESVLKSTLKLVVAQRLVRKICRQCRAEGTHDSEQAAVKALNISPRQKMYYGPGCKTCLNIGYWGRTALYEVLPITSNTSEAIFKANNLNDIRKDLGHFETLREKGISLIREGITTPSEVLRETS